MAGQAGTASGVVISYAGKIKTVFAGDVWDTMGSAMSFIHIEPNPAALSVRKALQSCYSRAPRKQKESKRGIAYVQCIFHPVGREDWARDVMFSGCSNLVLSPSSPIAL